MSENDNAPGFVYDGPGHAYEGVDLEKVRLWIEALRSGDFEQGSGSLGLVAGMNNEKQKFCCLGVACEIAIKNGLDLPRQVKDFKVLYGTAKAESYLPEEVSRWFGFATDNWDDMGGTYVTPANNIYLRDPETRRNRLASQWNDAHGWTFDKIADALEFTFFGGGAGKNALVKGPEDAASDEFPPPNEN